MNPVGRRRFLVVIGAGVVAVAAGGIALTVRQLSGSGQKTMLSFQALTGLPGKPFLSYASYVISGNVNMSSGTGSITKYVYAGPPENMTSISLLTRVVRVTGVRQQGSVWYINGVVDNQAQLQRGEDASFTLELDSASDTAQSTFFGSPIQLQLQKFVAAPSSLTRALPLIDSGADDRYIDTSSSRR